MNESSDSKGTKPTNIAKNHTNLPDLEHILGLNGTGLLTGLNKHQEALVQYRQYAQKRREG